MSAIITDWLKFSQTRKNGTTNATNRCQLDGEKEGEKEREILQSLSQLHKL